MARKKRTRLNPKPFFVIAVLIIIAVGGYFILSGGRGEVQYFEFAQCLAEQDATMYGFEACPNCQKQKFLIGKEAFDQYISGTGRYVLCRPDTEAVKPIGDKINVISVLPSIADQVDETTTQGELCVLNVALGTPTWVVNGQQATGWQTVPELAELSGCPVPEDFAGETETAGSRTTELN